MSNKTNTTQTTLHTRKKYIIGILGIIIILSLCVVFSQRHKKEELSYLPVLKTCVITVDGKEAFYNYTIENSKKAKSMKGDLYSESNGAKYYLLKGHNDYFQFIQEKDNCFSQVNFSSYRTNESFDTVLHNIIKADSSEDIAKVKFYSEHSYNLNNKDIKNPTVKIKDKDSLQAFYDILCRIETVAETLNDDDQEVSETSASPLSSDEKTKQQLESYKQQRSIDVTFSNGASLSFYYEASTRDLVCSSTIQRYRITSEEDNQWIMNQSKIS